MTAYEELVRRYQELALRVAYTITGSAPDAEEAAQEGFVRAYRALGRFHEGAPFRPWLLTIVANAARNRRSAVARHPTLALSAATDHASADPARSPEGFLIFAAFRTTPAIRPARDSGASSCDHLTTSGNCSAAHALA